MLYHQKSELLQVFHKLITTGNHRLQSLFDCLLTIIVNVSPYLKSISMVAANKLIHLIEAFSTPWFLFSSPTNHLLIFFLLEVLNNIIQYQFDGNSNLVYTIIRKRQVFYQLANLSSDSAYIMKMLQGRKNRKNDIVAESKSSITDEKPVSSKFWSDEIENFVMSIEEDDDDDPSRLHCGIYVVVWSKSGIRHITTIKNFDSVQEVI
ncbi:unnamed protein product [Onchocerca ochengi]|uniref:FPL domain-containing protein n=1 Tax=Onchocerca ochengi TaxID=42157 RepID=A0A182E012_ONCOC|nr:unnamed protein product [Onchocerca ochengi]